MLKLFFILVAILQLEIVSCTKYKRSIIYRFPETIALVVQYSSTKRFTFNLRKIEDNVDKTKVVVGDRTGVHEESQDQNKHYRLYRDRKLYAAFTVIDNQIDNKTGFSYYGSFRHDKQTYSLEPAHPGESKIENSFDKNYKVKINGIKYHLKSRSEKSQGRVDNSTVSKTDSTAVNPTSKGTDKKFVGKKQVMTVEVLVILDYSIFTKWMKLMKNNKTETVENMKYYYSEIFNGVKMRYEGVNMQNYMFTVALTGFYIAETSSKAPFTEDISIRTNEVIDPNKALKKLSEWLSSSVKTNLPRFDVVAVFTNYGMNGINGMAYVSGVCFSSGVSINRDTGPFQSADTTAHEIGHNLGAYHDSHNNTCTYEDQYIMASGRSVLNELNYDNPFLFSHCSLNYFISLIYKLNTKNQNCMEDYPSSDIPLYADKYIKASFGQTYSLDYQCKIVIGSGSYVCSGGEDSGINICFRVRCFSPKEKECVSVRPANRTSCGRKSWCVKGRCVRDRDAPKFRDKCLLGDSTTPIEINNVKQNCKDIISRNLSLCYDENYRYLCCDSCSKKETKKNKNCLFGDWYRNCNIQYCKSPYYRIVCCKTCRVNSSEVLVQSTCKQDMGTSWCRNIESYLCYQSQDLCCTKCAQFYDPSIAGCEYGDQRSWCARNIPSDCSSKSTSETCCKSCYGVAGTARVRPARPKPTKPTMTRKPTKPTMTRKPTKPTMTHKPTGCRDVNDCGTVMGWYCYREEQRAKCCMSCQRKIVSSEESCKYGDHASWCKNMITSHSYLCRYTNYLVTCCHSCKNL